VRRKGAALARKKRSGKERNLSLSRKKEGKKKCQGGQGEHAAHIFEKWRGKKSHVSQRKRETKKQNKEKREKYWRFGNLYVRMRGKGRGREMTHLNYLFSGKKKGGTSEGLKGKDASWYCVRLSKAL